MLDERKAAILRAVVQEYIETAQPVGSGRVSRSSGVRVSSATVRNEMAQLEQDGYLDQPHTSAGRVPTEKGYRFFVDQLDGPARLDATKVREVRRFFAKAHGELEQVLHETSLLLAGLTASAAVVVGPDLEAATVRSVQLVALNAKTILALAVLSNGVVEKRTLEFDVDVPESRVGAAGARLSAALVGRPPARPPDIAPSGDADLDALVGRALDAVTAAEHEPDHVYVGGTSLMAGSFDAVDSVRRVLTILEEHFVVMSLLHDVVDRGLQVAIGSETGVEPLADCAIVVAPYEIDGEQAGTIGVLGPTRMDYSQALAAVAVVGGRLGHHLADHG